MPSLQVCAKDENIVSVTNKTISNLLSNVKEIHKLHVKLVAELEQATSPSPYYTDCIGNIFLKYVSSYVREIIQLSIFFTISLFMFNKFNLTEFFYLNISILLVTLFLMTSC